MQVALKASLYCAVKLLICLSLRNTYFAEVMLFIAFFLCMFILFFFFSCHIKHASFSQPLILIIKTEQPYNDNNPVRAPAEEHSELLVIPHTDYKLK